MLIHRTARRIITATSRRAFYAVKRAWFQRIAARHNATLAESGRYTVSEFLRRVIGASEEFIAANAIRIGKAAAKAHRELFGANPAQDGLTVIGNRPRFTAIATYGPDAHAALEQATGEYWVRERELADHHVRVGPSRVGPNVFSMIPLSADIRRTATDLTAPHLMS